jgi:hypothetical protein
MICLGKESYTIECWESTIWGVYVSYALICKKIKNAKLLRCEIGMMSLFESVPLLNRWKVYISQSTYPTSIRNVLE